MIASPVIRAVVEAGYSADAMTMLAPVAEYATALGVFGRVFHVPLLENGAAAGAIVELRRRHYKLVLIPAPAPRWQYAATAWAIGGETTIIHRYGGSSSAIARLARFTEVPLRGGHRIAENMRLAEAAGLRCTGDASYLVPAAWKSAKRDSELLGLHTGSMSYKGNEQKRWPLERFARVANDYAGKGWRVRAFFGPNEANDASTFAGMAPAAEIVQRPLSEAARALSECAAVLANDSGIAHLAAGLGVTTLVLFGMTDPTRCKPIGPAVALRPSSCPPCFDEGMRRFECVRNIGYRCLLADIELEYVERAIATSLETVPPVQFESAGPLALYGRVRSS